MEIRIETIAGSDVKKYLDDVAALRLRVFREYPYLYDGDADYEREYLSAYGNTARSVVFVAFDGKRVVGASTALPLADETDNIQKPWRQSGADIDRIFYFGESVLYPEYRGQGIGVKFFERREAWARQFAAYGTCTFCAVIRPENHPLRPPGYVALDSFWRNRGYTQAPEKTCRIAWKEVDEQRESEKELVFWYKDISG